MISLYIRTTENGKRVYKLAGRFAVPEGFPKPEVMAR